ncbi:DUF3558 family protein [Gordonia aquimaris]|uniref:DUF3558 family protein n=1 Tax=Gordonia aquimaris TaxID=2984863 RepID=UPI003555CE99
MGNRGWFAALVALAALTASCSQPRDLTPESAPVDSTNPTGSYVRQTDSDGLPLPFVNRMPKRWNSSNDGSPYEPCTAMDQGTAAELGLDLNSVKDAAKVDGQTLRGCEWRYIDAEEWSWSAYQMVADYDGLADYKSLNPTFNWLENQEVDTRSVGVASLNSGQCFTYVQSLDSGVVTGVGYAGLPKPPLTEICQRAIDLTEATIDKIPE